MKSSEPLFLSANVMFAHSHLQSIWHLDMDVRASFYYREEGLKRPCEKLSMTKDGIVQESLESGSLPATGIGTLRFGAKQSPVRRADCHCLPYAPARGFELSKGKAKIKSSLLVSCLS
jgi:hypothetical protein